MRTTGLILLFLVTTLVVNAQQFYRVKADFTIKEKHANGNSQLVVGTVYYDKGAKKIVYSITFPEKETWVSSDTTTYKFASGKLASKHKVPFTTEFSIFHISLNGKLPNYGLEGSYYSIKKVEKENGMVITTWEPDPQLKGAFGNVIMSNKDKKLYGIVFMDTKGKVKSKQFYRNYTNTHGFEFPTEVIEISYTPKGENKKITTYKNIVVDDLRENNMYDYPLPK